MRYKKGSNTKGPLDVAHIWGTAATFALLTPPRGAPGDGHTALRTTVREPPSGAPRQEWKGGQDKTETGVDPQ